jgi:very-short-patch-repair endonuclease
MAVMDAGAIRRGTHTRIHRSTHRIHRFIARLDFAYRDAHVAIEADGFRYHDHRRDFDDERARGNEIEALGWHVLRITSKHLEQDRDGVTTLVRRALNRDP